MHVHVYPCQQFPGSQRTNKMRLSPFVRVSRRQNHLRKTVSPGWRLQLPVRTGHIAMLYCISSYSIFNIATGYCNSRLPASTMQPYRYWYAGMPYSRTPDTCTGTGMHAWYTCTLPWTVSHAIDHPIQPTPHIEYYLLWPQYRRRVGKCKELPQLLLQYRY